MSDCGLQEKVLGLKENSTAKPNFVEYTKSSGKYSCGRQELPIEMLIRPFLISAGKRGLECPSHSRYCVGYMSSGMFLATMLSAEMLPVPAPQ